MVASDFGWVCESGIEYDDAQWNFNSSEEEFYDTVSELAEEIEPDEASGFLEKLPQEVVSNLIWPRIVSEGIPEGICMSQQAYLRQIQILSLMSRVCKSWHSFVTNSYEWEYGIVNFIFHGRSYLKFLMMEQEDFDSSEIWRSLVIQ